MAETNIDGIVDCLQGVFSNKDGLAQLLKTVIEVGMAQEVAAHVGAGRHARESGRRGYRNGTKARTL